MSSALCIRAFGPLHFAGSSSFCRNRDPNAQSGVPSSKFRGYCQLIVSCERGFTGFSSPLYASRNSKGSVLRRRKTCRSTSDSESLKQDEEEGSAGAGATSELLDVSSRREGRSSASLQDLSSSSDGCIADFSPPSEKKRRGSDLATLLRRFWKVAAPYWSSEDKQKARLWLAGVFALTLATTGISVGFNFLGRDFYNALASKDQEKFIEQLTKYFAAFIGGIPVFVMRDYCRDTLALRWRGWMTTRYLDRYFENRTFYNIQSQSLIDNPDQRIVDDLNSFSGTALGFALALFNATINLISFSGILYGIYPPLFFVLLIYSIGGTAISVALGKGLVGLNFMQEKKEADFRYGLVRVRENAESIAFYGGEGSEIQLLLQRFKQSFDNYSQLLIASRNLDFFTSFYRYLIQLLPAAVVAPLYFAGKIEFGVINQSFSAFNNVLSDFSIIVYQFQSLSAFSAVVDRLGEFTDILDQQNALSQATFQNGALVKSGSVQPVGTAISSGEASRSSSRIKLIDIQESESPKQHGGQPLLILENLTLSTPQYSMTLFKDLSLVVEKGENLLIMGASGSGKTSLLRAIGGLWRSGSGSIKRYVKYREIVGDGDRTGKDVSTLNAGEVGNSAMDPPPQAGGVGEQSNGSFVDESGSLDSSGEVFFLPQRPYMVLGTLRQQLLYPTWSEEEVTEHSSNGALPFLSKLSTTKSSVTERPPPNDDELVEVLERVRLGHLMDRCDGLDSNVEWASVLSLGEQQRLAFARLLLSRPQLALMDESTSALDEDNEVRLYTEIQGAGVTYISVGHRSSLRRFHVNILQFQESKGNFDSCTWTMKPLLPSDSPKGL